MKIIIKHGLPFISAVLTYRQKELKIENILLDTGSGGTIFSTDLLNRIGLKPEPKDKIQRIKGVGGTEYVYQKQINFLSVGILSVNNFIIEIGAIDYGFDIQGIIGTDFLMKTEAVIDFKNLKLTSKISV
jgi:hypothetical protein